MNISAFAVVVFWRSPLNRLWQWIIFTTPIILFTFFIGQCAVLIAALFIGGFRLLPRYPALAGIVLALVSLKPQFALLLPFILFFLKEYKALVYMLVTLAILIALSGAIWGFECWYDFFAYNAAQLAKPLPEKMISPFAAMQMFEVPPDLIRMIQPIISIAVTILLCWKLKSVQPIDWTERLKLIVPALYLITPYCFVYDMCLFNAAWIFWLQSQGQKRLPAWDTFLYLCLWYLPLLNHDTARIHLPLIAILMVFVFIEAMRKKEA